MKLEDVLRKNKDDVALVIGNGINQYLSEDGQGSWDTLLINLASSFNLSSHHGRVPKGVALTEFYDLLEMASSEMRKKSLQREFSDLIAHWQPKEHHRDIVGWALNNKVPVLTTNFDNTLSIAGNCDLFSIHGQKRFTAFYPWNYYYGVCQIERPDYGFGIWHINGMQNYSQSIRLGLSHYMGSVSRARKWIHNRTEDSLFKGKDKEGWIGCNTWIHIIFNKPLAFIGLGLKENEVFLRWLLIERAKYFKRFPDRRRGGWFFYTKDEEELGKLFFLEGVGIQPVRVDSYDELYQNNVWADD